jgi:hypothetical protein
VRRTPVRTAPPALDADQRRVVEHPNGPLLVLAGPGTGKTTTLVETAVHWHLQRGVPLDGILGEDFLDGFVVTLDYRGQRVSLAREADDPPDAMPLTVRSAPYVEARVSLGDRTAKGLFEIDTGSNTAVEFWRPFARAAFGDAPTTTSAAGLGVAGVSVVENGHIDALEVAGRRIASPLVNFADETPPSDPVPRYGGVIGGPAWDGLVVTLDLPSRLIWLR